MDLDALRLFVHLARTLHFARTSKECHVSPSALSRTIQRLEEEAGATLFVRDRRSVTLTDEGRLVQASRATPSPVSRRWGSATRSSERLQGIISIFASVTACQSFLPLLLSAFRRAHPDVQIRLETGYALDALGMLRSGRSTLPSRRCPMTFQPPWRARGGENSASFRGPCRDSAVSELLAHEPVPGRKSR